MIEIVVVIMAVVLIIGFWPVARWVVLAIAVLFLIGFVMLMINAGGGAKAQQREQPPRTEVITNLLSGTHAQGVALPHPGTPSKPGQIEPKPVETTSLIRLRVGAPIASLPPPPFRAQPINEPVTIMRTRPVDPYTKKPF